MKPEEARLMTKEPECAEEKWVAKNPSLRAETASFPGFCCKASGLFATALLKTASIFPCLIDGIKLGKRKCKREREAVNVMMTLLLTILDFSCGWGRYITFARYDSELFIDYNALVYFWKLLAFGSGSDRLRKVSFVVSRVTGPSLLIHWLMLAWRQLSMVYIYPSEDL